MKQLKLDESWPEYLDSWKNSKGRRNKKFICAIFLMKKPNALVSEQACGCLRNTKSIHLHLIESWHDLHLDFSRGPQYQPPSFLLEGTTFSPLSLQDFIQENIEVFYLDRYMITITRLLLDISFHLASTYIFSLKILISTPIGKNIFSF